MNSRANRVARYLETLGIGLESLVGIYLERSTEMMVSVLAILKTGAAYLPLDLNSPRDRIGLILNQSGARAVLTLRQFKDSLPEDVGSVVCIDAEWDVIANESSENLGNRVDARQLVYVLYTSGSTGQPKGVLIEHRQLLNYTLSIIERFDLEAGTSFAMVQPLTVDSCNTMIYASMLTGGCLHTISREVASDAVLLSEYFERHWISHLKIAPSHLESLHASGNAAAIMPKDRLVIGGESSRWDFVESLHALSPSCRMFNHYGPTEATVGVLTYELQDRSRTSGSVSLGRPLGNTTVFVLDCRLNPLPVGFPGRYIQAATIWREGI